jgi:FdhD protein
MTGTMAETGLKKVEITKFANASFTTAADLVSIEEPLEIRLGWSSVEGLRQIAVTMRTPGDERELAAGFLFTEGIVSAPSDIEQIEVQKCNVVNVFLRKGIEVDSASLERHSFVASSCGVCGKKSIAAVRVKRRYDCVHDVPQIAPELVRELPDLLRKHQTHFDRSGGIHASGLFDSTGKLIELREDVGRHNALDKVLGAALLAGKLPLTQHILVVSGRASFELVQKSTHAGLPIMIAVGAPSSLAVQLASECDMTLIGFARDDRFNVYSGLHRVVGA